MPKQAEVLPAILLFVAWLMGCGQSGSPATEKPAATAPSVTFVGNSGFLITVGDRKVLIDALFSGLPSAVQTPLLNAKAPFDDVNLILATHNHPDHFSASLVRQHMQNSPKAVFMSTQQAAGQLTGFGDRVITVDPVEGSPVNASANEIGVEAVYLNHGYAQDDPSEVFNNGYVVTVGAIRFFHTGDVYDLDDARQYGLTEQSIDLAFIQHYFFQDSSSLNYINEVVGARYLFPIHYLYTTPAFDAIKIRNDFPEAIVFSAGLESWSLPAP